MTKKVFEKRPTTRRISGKEFAKALGAEETGIKIHRKMSPFSLFSLRQFLVAKLRSR